MVDAVCTAVDGSARTGCVLDASSAREDRSSDVRYVGDTHDSDSLKKMMTASYTPIISAQEHERLPSCSTSCHIATCSFSSIVVAPSLMHGAFFVGVLCTRVDRNRAPNHGVDLFVSGGSGVPCFVVMVEARAKNE